MIGPFAAIRDRRRSQRRKSARRGLRRAQRPQAPLRGAIRLCGGVIDQHFHSCRTRNRLQPAGGPLGIAAQPTATASVSMPRATDTAEAPRIFNKLMSPISGDSISKVRPAALMVAPNTIDTCAEALRMNVQASIETEAQLRPCDRLEHPFADTVVTRALPRTASRWVLRGSISVKSLSLAPK